MDDNLRQFRGKRRTSRMIQHVIEQHPNQRVLLMFNNTNQARHEFNRFLDVKKRHIDYTSDPIQVVRVTKNDRSITLTNDTVLAFKAVDTGRFDWHSKMYEGYPASQPIYIDHSVFELKFPEILNEFHRWDK